LQHQFAVHCRIVGRCSSAAAFIALAADTRTIAKTGYVLLHTARRLATMDQWEAIQRSPLHERRAINDGLADINDASAVLLRDRLGVSEEVARRWLNADEKWTAAEAIERGFAIAAADDHLGAASW
jgi:ATP-dependent protease ClpP protease subunit